MDKKKALRDSLFEFYRKIMFMKDMSIIEKNSRTVYEAYSQIISLIIDAHHNIAMNDVHSLPNITTQIDQAMTRIPNEVWQKNPSVIKEIEKLKQETKLYKLLKQYDEKKESSTDTQDLQNEIKTLIVGVSRDSPEDTNLIDYAKSILQNKSVASNSQTDRKTTINDAVVRSSPVREKTIQHVSQTVKSQTEDEPQHISEEEKEEEQKSKEFEKTVSAAFMLSALDENSKDDLPDLSEEIEKRNKNQKEQAEKTNTKEHHKNKISSNIFRLKEMLKHK